MPILEYNQNVLNHCKGFKKLPHENLMKTDPWLGFELECRVIGAVSSEGPLVEGVAEAVLKDCDGQAIVKWDGTVDDGFEIVSIPATIGWHHGAWDKFFAQTAKKLSAWGNQKVGIHVHFSRSFLGTKAAGKMLCFLNSASNSSLINTIAGREPTEYCKREFADIGLGSRLLSGNIGHHASLASGKEDRKGLRTIELRIFQGNVARNGLLRALEFTHMLPKFVRSADVDDLNKNGFVNWFADNANKYPEFLKWGGGERLPIFDDDRLKRSRNELPYAA